MGRVTLATHRGCIPAPCHLLGQGPNHHQQLPRGRCGEAALYCPGAKCVKEAGSRGAVVVWLDCFGWRLRKGDRLSTGEREYLTGEKTSGLHPKYLIAKKIDQFEGIGMQKSTTPRQLKLRKPALSNFGIHIARKQTPSLTIFLR